MNHKGEKIGKVLKNNGLIFPSSSNRTKKIIPLFIEDENVKFERNQIIKSHSIFQNEINNNYTNYYLDNVSDLLFQNDKLYYKKAYYTRFFFFWTDLIWSFLRPN